MVMGIEENGYIQERLRGRGCDGGSQVKEQMGLLPGKWESIISTGAVVCTQVVRPLTSQSLYCVFLS